MSLNQKTSDFTTKTTFDTVDFVTGLSAGTTNVKFTYSALFDAMSGLTNLNNVGDPLGVPLLDQPTAGTNNFRMLESTKGVIATVSAQNGINLGCNFTQSTVGTTLIKDLNASQYKFKTLKPGTDMALSDDGESITISFAATSQSLKTVVIAKESDFPTPVGGLITLSNDADYFLQGDIVTSNRFKVGTSTTLRGPASQIVKLTYTGTGDMFTGVNPNFRIDRITVSCPSGNLLNMTSPLGSGIIQIIESNIESCNTGGTIDGQFICRIKGVAWEDIKTKGITFTGSGSNLAYDTGVIFLNGGSFIDLTTAKFSAISITNQVVQTSAVGTTFLSGTVSSGNLNISGLGTVTNTKIFGNAAPLSGISSNDERWDFALNNNIANTRQDALLSFQTPTVTVLAAATPTLINGLWLSERTSHTTGTSAGRVTYNDDKDATLPITVALNINPVSGTNKSINVYLAKNGSIITNSKVSSVVSSSSPENQVVIWQDVFSTNDYYEVFIESVDGTDLQVNTATFRIN